MNEGHRKQVLTTLHFPRRAAWRERVDVLRPDRGRGPALARTLVRASKRYDAMVVDADG
jgi:hypothetical protein